MEKNVTSLRDSEENRRIQEMLDKKALQKQRVEQIIPYLGFAFIFVLFTIVTKGKFLSANNIENLIVQSFSMALFAIGAIFVYAHAGTDMSVAATSACGQLALAALLLAGAPLWLAILACIAVTMLGASSVAGIALVLGVPVFIGSMCIRTSFQGILQFVTRSGDLIIDYQKYEFMNNTALKAVILLALMAIGIFLYNYTVFGKYNKLIGGNQVTAEQGGIRNKKWIFIAFLFLGLCVGIASVFSFFRIGKVTGTTASGMEFNLMIAMALGGVPSSGGEKTKISSAILGALTVSFLVNGLQVWGLDVGLINGVKGLLFVIIVALSYDRSNGKLIS